MRRWIFRIILAIAILLVLVIASVQIVLWTPLPRRIVVQQIEKELGLRISAKSLSVGWLGKSELHDVSLGLPLSSNDFLKVQTLRIQHNSLIGLALGHAVAVDSIEIDDPTVEVVQDAQGNWNLQQVVDLLGKAGGSNTAQQSNSNQGVPKLPIIKLVNGSVHVSDNQHHTLALQPLNVSGSPDGALVWDYKATIGDSISAEGQVAPGGNWQHRVTLVVQHLDPLVSNWGVPTTYNTELKANWSGQFADGKLTGVLSMQQASARGVPTLGDVHLDGSVDVQSTGGVLTVRPNKLSLATTYATLPNLKIQSGTIVLDATGVHANGVQLAALGGVADVHAGFDPRTQAVDLHARWSGLSLAKQTSKSGTLDASLTQPFPGRPVIQVELNTNGTVGDSAPDSVTPPDRWVANVTLNGTGSSWKQIDWVLAAPLLRYSSGNQAFDLSRTTAHIAQRLPVVELTDLSLPIDNVLRRPNAANFASSGRVDFATTKWNFDATGGFNAVYQDEPVPITLALHASGNKDRYDLKTFSVVVSNVTLLADGSYDRTQPKPVDLHVQLQQEPHIVPDAPVQGDVAGKFNIRGLLFKDEENHFRPYLSIDGDLTSNDLVLLNRPVGNIDIKLQGNTSTPMISKDECGPIKTEIHTTDFVLFEAPWNFSAMYPNPDGKWQATLETKKLPLEELARVARMTGVTGEVTDAKWTVQMTSPTVSGIDLQSEYHITKPTGAGFTADTVDATATLHDGVLQLNPLLAKSGAGSITTTASVDLKSLRHLYTETTVDHWPYPISSAVVAQLNAHNKLDVDLHSKQIGATGSLTAVVDLLYGGTSLAHAQLDAGIQKRIVKIISAKGNILTGTYEGSALLDLDKPLEATGRVLWKDVDLASIGTIFPGLTGGGGTVSGAFTLEPARDPRPLEPVRFDLNLASQDAHFRSLQIGNHSLLALHAVGYLNTDRAVLDHSDIFLGGGVMHLWARADHRSGRGLSTQSVIDFEKIQLDQLAHINPKMTKPMPGVLDGQITLVRSGTQLSQLLGSAHVNLNQTDLVNFGPLTALYNLMNAAGGISSKPNGAGSIDLSFEQNVIHVSRFQFFNRGIDARGLFTVGPLNYANFDNTFISGQVVGTARALKGTQLPLLSDFDTVFSALAGQLTTVNVVGSIKDPKYPQATLADIGTTMRQILVGDASGG